jgi:hypothetical protein
MCWYLFSLESPGTLGIWHTGDKISVSSNHHMVLPAKQHILWMNNFSSRKGITTHTHTQEESNCLKTYFSVIESQDLWRVHSMQRMQYYYAIISSRDKLLWWRILTKYHKSQITIDTNTIRWQHPWKSETINNNIVTSRGSIGIPEDCILLLVHCDIRKHNKQQQTQEQLIQDPQ